MTVSKARILLLVGIAGYVAAFQWMYLTWLFPTFDYWGFSYEPPPLPGLILSCVMGVLPGLWLPLNLTRPSQLITWVLFITVLVPSMFVPWYMAMRGSESVAVLLVSLFAGFCLVSASDRIPLWRIRPAAAPRLIFWPAFWIIFAALVTWVVAVYIGQFRLVTFGEIYEQLRFSGQEIAAGTGVSYAVMWLSGALVPFLMTWAISRRKYLWVLLGAATQMMLYSTAGLKSILLSVAMIPLIYAMVSWRRIPFGLQVTGLTVFGFIILNGANLMQGDLSPAHLMLSALVFMRTFGISGLSTAQYHDFFLDHPQTYYSHINGISLLVDYPYERALGREVGYFYSGNLDLNSNAHLWCTDGLAAWGIPGIIVISVLCAMTFWLLDSVAQDQPINFSATAVTFAALNLSNASLFTSLLSGGLILIFLMLFLMPRKAGVVATESVSDLEPPEGSLLSPQLARLRH